MRPEQIDYSSRKLHFFDIAHGEVLAGKTEAHTYAEEVATPKDIKPLSDLLHDPNFKQTYPALDTTEWGREKYVSYGKWIKALVKPPGAVGPGLNRDLLIKARRLGVGPGESRIRNEFGNISNFYIAAGSVESHIIGNFKDWTIDDFVGYIKRVGGNQKPTIESLRAYGLRAPNNPMPEFMHVRFHEIGGLSALIELAGYNVIERWDKDDYVEWGVKFVEANDGMVPTSRMADYLSLQKKGPAGSSIRNKFVKMKSYQSLVVQSYEDEKNNKDKTKRQTLSELKNDLLKEDFPPEIFSTGFEEAKDKIVFYGPALEQNSDISLVEQLTELLGEKELLARFAKYKVIDEVLPKMRQERKIMAAINQGDFISEIKKYKNNDTVFSAGEVEHAALVLQVFDYIWPMDGYLDNLKLDEGYSLYYRKLEENAQAERLAKQAIACAL